MAADGLQIHRGQERVFEFLLGVAALVLLIAGCLVTLRPFLWAALWSAILCFSTWPAFRWLLRMMGGHRSLAALAMTLALAVCLGAPFAVVGWGLAGEAKEAVAATRAAIDRGPPELPQWLSNPPVFGSHIREWVDDFRISPADRRADEETLLAFVKKSVIYLGAAVGHGVVQIFLSLLIGFFLFRDGGALSIRLDAIITRLAGGYQGARMLAAAQETLISVVYGILGTALIHGLVAGVGLWIAGVPGVLLLSFSTFVLSILPFGPAMIWLPAALWLLHEGARGHGIFLIVWGVVLNSVVDSAVRPWLISRGGAVPLILVILGVLGGAAAFGFIGVFLGPTMLAIGYGLLDDWSSSALALAPGAGCPLNAEAPQAIAPDMPSSLHDPGSLG